MVKHCPHCGNFLNICPHCYSILQDNNDLESEADFFSRFQDYIEDMNEISRQFEIINQYRKPLLNSEIKWMKKKKKW